MIYVFVRSFEGIFLLFLFVDHRAFNNQFVPSVHFTLSGSDLRPEGSWGS